LHKAIEEQCIPYFSSDIKFVLIINLTFFIVNILLSSKFDTETHGKDKTLCKTLYLQPYLDIDIINIYKNVLQNYYVFVYKKLFKTPCLFINICFEYIYSFVLCENL